MTHVLAIDQGTTVTKAMVLSAESEILAEAEVTVMPRTSAGGAAEHDPEELWRSVVEAGREAVRQSGVRIGAIGLANQGETVLAWNRETGKPLSRAIVWNDRRALSVCRRLSGEAETLTALTGLQMDPYFAAPKMTWLREHVTTEGVVTMTDAWLLSRLCGTFVTDAATASRSMLLDLDAVAWSPHACRLFGVDETELPAIVDCAGPVGETRVFGTSAPVTGIAVDQQAALFGHRCTEPGDAKCTYGTGAFLLANMGRSPTRSHAGLSSSVAWRLGGETTYCVDGQVYTVGSALEWLRNIELVFSFAEFDATVDNQPAAGTPIFVPALSGLAAPFWKPEARGAFVGLSLATTRAEILRSVVEGIAAQVAWLGRATADDIGRRLTGLGADGGLTRSRALMQSQADLLQLPVDVYPTGNATALGVAGFARLGVTSMADSSAVLPRKPAARYEPRIGAAEADERLHRWRRAAEATAELH